MNLRVDLLLDGERRYQGPVSTRFAIRVGLMVAAGMLGMLALFLVNTFVGVRREYVKTKERWDEVNPKYRAILEIQRRQVAIHAMSGELVRWERSRLGWSGLLLDLQKVVPASVQLTRLSVRSDWEVPLPAPAPMEGGEGGTRPASTSAPPRMISAMTVEGRAVGSRGEGAVSDFMTQLGEQERFRTTLESTKLQRLDRDSQSGDLVFEIIGGFTPRTL
jgi:hypothetical protein